MLEYASYEASAYRPSQSGWNNNFAVWINSLVETRVSGGGRKLLMMKKLFIITGIIFFITSSCSKIEHAEFQHEDKMLVGSTNQTNPYNYVGEEHNECLAALGADDEFGSMTDVEETQFIIDWFYNKDGIECDFDAEAIVQVVNSVDFDNLSLSIEANTWYENSDISAIQRDVLFQLDSIINTAFSDYDLFNQNCTELEIEISNLNIDESEKVLLWGAVSVARYSGDFWNNAYNNQSSPWSFICDCPYHGGAPSQQKPNCVGHIIADSYGWCRGLVTNIGGGKLLHHAKVSATNMSRKYDHRND